MSLSGVYGSSDDAAAIRLIHRAIELGVDHFDSSDMYGWGQNEELLGRALKARRNGIIIVTKFGQTRQPGGANGVDGRPEYVAQACEASLKRLGIDVIDLYYQHRVDPNTPIEDTAGALAELVAEGKVRYIGLSEAGADTIRRAHAVHPVAALQTEYSLWTRDPEAELLPLLRELGIGFVPYSPLGKGRLARPWGATSERGNVDQVAKSFDLDIDQPVVEAVQRGLADYRDPSRWRGIQRAGMARDFGWASAARAYGDIYARIRSSA